MRAAPETSKGGSRFRIRGAYLFFLFVLLLAAELVLRLYPSYLNNWRASIRYQPDSLCGYRLVPDAHASFAQQCVKTTDIHINSKGFRGPEWGEARGGIALLGDSFLEALQVTEGKDIASLMRQLRGSRVINAGVSGYGTVAAYETYIHYVHAYHPDTVILFYYSGNDLMNNSCELNAQTGSEFVYPCACGERDAVTSEIRFYVPAPSGRHSGWMREHSFLWRSLSDALSGKGREKEVDPWQIYYNPGSHERQDAARITLEALKRLRDAVWADSAIFCVVNVPPYLSVAPEGPEEAKRTAGRQDFGKEFDLYWPELELIQMCGELGVPLLDLSPVFIRYREQTHLSYPYFYFPCNGHWNELGHRLAANELESWLRRNPDAL